MPSDNATSSLTVGAYLPRLKSVRLILAVAFAPHASFFRMGCGIHKNEVTVSVTGLVMPFIVKFPWTKDSVSPENLSTVDINVMLGCRAVSKNPHLASAD